MPDLSFIASVATVAAALLAAIPLFGGVTRGHRLRRAEQVLRDATSVTTDERQKAILLSLHQQTVAKIVAVQLTPMWRLWWPVAAFVAYACLYVDPGRQVGEWFLHHPQNPWDGLVAGALHGDVVWLVGLGPVLLAQLYESFRLRLRYRAKTANDYATGSGYLEAKPLMGLDIWKPEGGWTVRSVLVDLAVGYSAAVLPAGLGFLWSVPRPAVAYPYMITSLTFVGVAVGLSLIVFILAGFGLMDYERMPRRHPSGVHGLPSGLANPTAVATRRPWFSRWRR